MLRYIFAMVDSSGPGSHIRKCNTLAFTDLADLEDFETPGIENKIYGLKLSEGVYKRAEIPVAVEAVPVKLSDLSDVEIERDIAINTRFNIVRNDIGKWKLLKTIEKDDWWINIAVTSPYVMTGREHNLKKIINNGRLLASYYPAKKKSIIVTPIGQTPGYYALSSRPSVKNVSLKLATEFNTISSDLNTLPGGSTIYMECQLGDHPDGWLTILQGLSIRWYAKHETFVCAIFVQIKKEGEIESLKFVSMPGVEVKVTNVSLNKILLPYNIHLKRLMFTPVTLPINYLKIIVNNI